MSRHQVRSKLHPVAVWARRRVGSGDFWDTLAILGRALRALEMRLEKLETEQRAEVPKG